MSLSATAQQNPARPTQKVTIGVFAGALSAIIVWILNTFWLTGAGRPITPEIAQFFTIVVTFVTSYLVPPSAFDGVVQQSEN